MPLIKLTPLQARFTACLSASVVLLLLYLTLTKPSFAYALEADSSRISSEDHNFYVIQDRDEGQETEESRITVRAEVGVSALANNDPASSNIEIGQTQNWVFPRDAINGPHGTPGVGLPGAKVEDAELLLERHELRKRQTGNKVYITLNTCLQPSPNATNAIPPQLQMYISLSESNQKPGPGTGDPDQHTITVDGGYAIFEADADSDVYVGISAPNTTEFSGIWNYNIAASIDAPFHGFEDPEVKNLYFVDGDNHAALLITNDTTQALPNQTIYEEWMKLSPPWGVFATNQNQREILGIQKSFCGLKNNARLTVNIDNITNQNVAQMTNRGLGGKPKEQFYITGLNATSKYWGMLVMEGNSTDSGAGVVGGGGTVWAAMEFETKTDNNCRLMYNLSFCSEVAYAVPSNPNKFSPETGLPDLAALYDSYAAQMYQYFNYSLQQIPCNTTSSAQYSLARNCDDCARAYKQWLCAVTIPRCADFSSSASFLKPRNLGQPFINGSSISSDPSQFNVKQASLDAVATNSSRNPLIDTSIQPGPYKEVLPCEDLCYDLVQSCPASLGFACPLRGKGLEDSYGKRVNGSAGVISCSYLGAAYYLSGTTASTLLRPSVYSVAFLAVLLGLGNIFL
ncbi:Calcium influx-promoting protein ehs1 [Fonsecaea pedrosoi]|nr:Calcium influx-promoting protein ehs1 [Fonsecaea pedrosoi]